MVRGVSSCLGPCGVGEQPDYTGSSLTKACVISRALTVLLTGA